METLKVDVRGFPDEKIRELERFIQRWKQEARIAVAPAPIRKRRVDPSEFIPHLTRFKAPLTRALAYEE